MISQYQKTQGTEGESLFEPLTPQPAYRRVSAAIERKILERSLRPGDWLPTETELARQFAVNRSTVREALRQLESTGLVGRASGSKKMLVTRPDQQDTAIHISRALALDEVTVLELWEAMLVIAPRLAALAASCDQESTLAGLHAAAGAVESARSTSAAVTAVGDYFGRLAELQPVISLLAPSLRRMIDRVPRGRERIVVAQRRIIDALAAGDAGKAEKWMTRHVQDFRRGYELAGIALDTRAAAARPRSGD